MKFLPNFQESTREWCLTLGKEPGCLVETSLNQIPSKSLSRNWGKIFQRKYFSEHMWTAGLLINENTSCSRKWQ